MLLVEGCDWSHKNPCGFSSIIVVLATIYEDNVTCIDQLKKRCIEGENTKHIALKYFFTHQQQRHHKVEVKQIWSQNNLADIFMKSLPKSLFIRLFTKLDCVNIQICITSSSHGESCWTQKEYSKVYSHDLNVLFSLREHFFPLHFY